MKAKTKVYIVGFAAMTALGFGLRNAYFYAKPISVTGADVKDASVYGNPEQTIEQSKKLMKALDATNDDWNKVPRELLTFSDQKMAENPATRDRKSTAFFTPSNGSVQSKEIYFFTDVYLRRNAKQYRGDRTKASPSGFYIVAFRNGEVKKISPKEVRLSPRGSVFEYTFPGMASYKLSNPKLPWYRDDGYCMAG